MSNGSKLAAVAKANTSEPTSHKYLDTLVTGASCHSPAVKIIRHVVDKILVVCSDATRDKHDCS